MPSQGGGMEIFMNTKQVIISLSREFGSAGHIIGETIAKRLGIPIYDSNLLQEIAVAKNLDVKNLEKYDEVPKNKLFSRNVKGYSNSPEENIANIQFDYIRKKAENGESFVIVGRCSEEVLKDFDCLITLFILADTDKKIERIKKVYGVSESEAKSMILKQNKKRKVYHNHYCEGKWGDSRNYEFSINSSKLGIDKTADIIETYIKERMENF